MLCAVQAYGIAVGLEGSSGGIVTDPGWFFRLSTTLTLMGAHDEVLRPERVREVHDVIPGASGYLLYPDGWHWLFSDRQAARVWDDVAEFALGLAAASP